MEWKAHRHLKPSMWKELRALRMSFESYNIGDLREQSIACDVGLNKIFNGSTELPSSALKYFSGRVALETAKKVRRPPFSQK